MKTEDESSYQSYVRYCTDVAEIEPHTFEEWSSKRTFTSQSLDGIASMGSGSKMRNLGELARD